MPIPWRTSSRSTQLGANCQKEAETPELPIPCRISSFQLECVRLVLWHSRWLGVRNNAKSEAPLAWASAARSLEWPDCADKPRRGAYLQTFGEPGCTVNESGSVWDVFRFGHFRRHGGRRRMLTFGCGGVDPRAHSGCGGVDPRAHCQWAWRVLLLGDAQQQSASFGSNSCGSS